MFNSFEPQVLFQEVPDHISLCFTITGCPVRCKGCHSKDTWPSTAGTHLSDERFNRYLTQYSQYVSCVLFFGGEWCLEALCSKLKKARESGMSTCLYTGLNDVPDTLKSLLTYIKTGPYIRTLGGLENPNTNQRFIELANGQVLNIKFQESSLNATT
jgi:anaerobic ribonucleoside-triphosphate reductase activating protein